jgi:hypothetical protein
MANWKLKLRVGRDRRDYENGTITLEELCCRYAKKIEDKLPYIRDRMKRADLSDEAEDIAHDFKAMVETVAEFDEALERLYNWADTTLNDKTWPHEKLCWVEPTATVGTRWMKPN